MLAAARTCHELRPLAEITIAKIEFQEGEIWLQTAAGLVQERGRLRLSEFMRLDNVGNRNYVGSVIVNETNFRYFEPAPRRNMSAGIQASLQF